MPQLSELYVARVLLKLLLVSNRTCVRSADILSQHNGEGNEPTELTHSTHIRVNVNKSHTSHCN